MNARIARGLAAIGLFMGLTLTLRARAQPFEPVPVSEQFLAFERAESGEWSQARDAALARFIRLAKSRPQELGLDQPVQRNDLIVLDPLREAVVFIEKLKSFDGRNAAALIEDQERLMFPILQKKQVVSSVTVAKLRNGNWVAAAFGAAPLVRALMATRLKVAAQTVDEGRPELLLHAGKRARYRSVTITGLNYRFLAAEGPGGSYLTPLLDAPELGFKRGVPVLAREVFTKLLPSARLHNGLPT